eukprot:Awhi_evm1s11756
MVTNLLTSCCKRVRHGCDIPEIATLRNCASVDDCSGTDGKTDILCTNCTDGFYLDSQTCNGNH